MTTISFSQGEGNYWYFGDEAGINFNTIPPTVLTDSEMNNLEAVDAISDADGNLLFYTSGWRIWNREHDPMPNGSGLEGSWTSTCTSIVKKPGSDHLYYVFTIGDYLENVGLKYSVVDMNLEGGLGDVTEKNVNVRNYVSEKILVVPHANGHDYWIIVYQNGPLDLNYFHSHLLTDEGLVIGGPTSDIEIGYTGPTSSGGQLKVNQSLNKVAAAFGGHGLGVFSLDNSTGVITTDFFYDDFPVWNLYVVPRVYGLEFSKTGNFLYVSHRIGPLTMTIYQFDLENLPVTQLDLIPIGEFTAAFEPGLQIGPNGKIYSAAREQEFIQTIHFPDLPFPECYFELNAVYLEGKISKTNLPTRKSYDFQDPIAVLNTCLGDTTLFSIDLSGSNEPDSVVWNFDDPLSDMNSASGDSVSHEYLQLGTYRPTVTIYSGDVVYPLAAEVIINEVPNFSLGNDTTFCYESSIILSHDLPYDSVFWNDNITSETLEVNEIGYYTLTADNFGCITADSIFVDLEYCNLEVFDIYPNPSIGSTIITYQVPDYVFNYGLRIHDNLGRLVEIINLSESRISYTLSTSDYSSGVYSVSFFVEGELLETKQLVVVK